MALRGMERPAVMRRFILPAVTLALVIALCCMDVADAAKKKKSTKSKSKGKLGAGDPMRCAVCMAVVDEIQYELSTTENSTSTLDLRWGLTAEVTEGRAKRIGKVIPYKRSELRSIEVMEKVCEAMKNYGIDENMPGETQLRRTNKRPDEDRDMSIIGRLKINSDDQKKFERFCEELIDGTETDIIESIRDNYETYQMEDRLCWGSGSVCGSTRPKCPIGSFSARNGTVPCSPCAKSTFQDKEGKTACTPCKQYHNTSGTGSNSSKDCLPLCKPGNFAPQGLTPCNTCGIGMYQSEYGQETCNKCPDGKGTRKEGSVALKDCVSVCGDRSQSIEEQCDDGNFKGGDGCDHRCNIEAGYVCAGSVGSMHTCNKVVCGDGRTQASSDGQVTEECDDGNTDGGDGCSSDCKIETGHLCQLEGELSRCDKVVCGDGKRQNSQDMTVMEQCDDGNTDANDGCSSTCQVEPNHICEGMYLGLYSCHHVTCGDGYKEKSGDVNEECDDGNTVDGDGCSKECRVEATYECDDGSARRNVVGPPDFAAQEKSVCTKKVVCGDGKKETDRGEKCDDGNIQDGDGCSSTCTVEPGYACWANREPNDGSPVPGPDDIVPDTCRLVDAETKLAPDDVDDLVPGGEGRKKPAVHRAEL